MKFDIERYSIFDNYTVMSCGDNISNVMDKLLRLTTKLTESYASDILFLVPLIDKAMEDGTVNVNEKVSQALMNF